MCGIVGISRRPVARISTHHPLLHEPRIDLLGVGILKNNSRFDFLVEKTTEIGVMQSSPFLQDARSRHAGDRWRNSLAAR